MWIIVFIQCWIEGLGYINYAAKFKMFFKDGWMSGWFGGWADESILLR